MHWQWHSLWSLYSCIISYWTYSQGCLTDTTPGNNMERELVLPWFIPCKMQRWWKNGKNSYWYLHVLANWDLYLHSYLFSSNFLTGLGNTQFEKLIWNKCVCILLIHKILDVESSDLPNDLWAISCLISWVLLKMW